MSRHYQADVNCPKCGHGFKVRAFISEHIVIFGRDERLDAEIAAFWRSVDSLFDRARDIFKRMR